MLLLQMQRLLQVRRLKDGRQREGRRAKGRLRVQKGERIVVARSSSRR